MTYIATTESSPSTSCVCGKKHRTVTGAERCTTAELNHVKAVRGGKLAFLTPSEWDSLSEPHRSEAARDWARY
jgi:hypothetical protein